ncbi:LamG-like jellyroll fold domain-containing protein [Actinoplanes regularis]|uniref:LamG-like jellyroll fold domain-containing protein n=1 Tax=Actinoplanes regularis TaxID=52697 RepID=UPI001944B400|nr:LamG-like jellyroll fold domain-containing protein [Actinoplanes regularis]
MGLSVGVPPEVVPEHGGWPLSGLLSALRQAPALAAVAGLPKQERGGATGDVDHYVSTGKTQANGGAGTAPGRGKGIVDPEQPNKPAQKAVTTPKKPGDENSFDKLTSKRLPKRSSATYDEFENEDGSFTRVISDERVNFKAPDGSYQPIDTKLTKRGDRLETGANSIDVSLLATGADTTPTAATPTVAPSASTPAAPESPAAPSLRVESAEDALVAVTTASGYSMAYDLAGAAAVPAVVNGSTATYNEILPGTDLELRTTNSGTKDTLILKSPAAGNEWVFPLKLQGLTAKKQSDGSLNLVAADGKVAMRVPRGYMQDSKVDPHSGAPAESIAVQYDLITVDGGPALKVTADAAWLNDPARQYPVRMDPEISTADTGDIFTDNSTSTVEHNGDNLPVGTWNGGDTISRSFMHFDEFDNDGLVGTQIKSAKLFMFHTWSYNCGDHDPIYVRRATSKWTVADIEAANGVLSSGPTYSSPIATWTITDNYPACTNTGGNRGTGAWRSVSLPTQTFNGWSTGTMSNFGLALTASESDSTAFKRFTSANYGDTGTDPRIEITYDYNTDPQVNEQYPAYGATAATLTPELIADANDPDNWPKTLEYNFFVYDKDQKTQIATSGWQAKKSWTVPVGTFTWNESYYWTVQVRDGLADNHEYLIKNLLTTPVPQPSITSALSQNPGQGFDSVIGNYTTAARDAMVNTIGPPLEINRQYNSSDPRIGQAFGAGWSSIADVKATEKPVTINGSQRINTVVVTYPTGRELAFGRNNDGSYLSPAGQASTFTEATVDDKRVYRLTEKDGTTYEFKQLVTDSPEFPVMSIKDASGRTQTFAYTDGRLTTITAASGRTLDLIWTETSPKHVAYVATDPVTPGDWDSVNTWKYEYTGDSLTKVCPPDNWGDCHTYQYNATGSLFPTAMVNARPHSYWRLNETTGTTAASSMLENAGADVGTYSGVTLGQGGPLAGTTSTAAAFNGTSSQLQIPSNLASDGANQAISMWFKSSTTGGDSVLYGQSMEAAASTAATTNRAYNPNLYIGSDGQLMGGFAKAPKLGASLGTLTAVGQGQCLTVPGNVSTNGTRLAIANCAGTANQLFTWATSRQLQVTTGGVVKCVDTEDQEATNGTDLVINTCASTAGSQRWDVQADGQIVSDFSGLCLDSVGDGSQTNALMQIWACGKSRPVDQLFLTRIHTPMAATTTVNGVVSALKVNDNAWHHVVLSASGNRQDLYLDGKPVAFETGVTVQDITPASSFIGKGFLGGGWPNQSHANANSNLGTRDYFTGSIADVAVFDTPVDGQLAADLYSTRNSVSLMTKVVRPSGNATAEIAYDPITSRVSQVKDGNGETWTPEKPAIVGSTKIYESAVLGGAPTNYWRMAESGVTQAVNQVNGNIATYNSVGLGSVDGPFGTANKAASLNGTSSFVALPTDVTPAGNSSVSMWFNTTTVKDVLLGMKSSTRFDTPTMWIDADGKLRALSPSKTPTGPLNSTQIPGKCADVQGSGTADDTPIQIYTCNGTAAQNWTFTPDSANVNFTVRALGKCLAAKGGTLTTGTKVVLDTCDNTAGQSWVPINGALMAGSKTSGVCLDDPGQSKTDGTDLQLYTCNYGKAQTWMPALTSKAAVNDGKWHHAVLATSGLAQTLYVDGAKVQSTSGSVAMAPDQAAAYTLGQGYTDGLGSTTVTSRGSLFHLEPNVANYFAGSVAEVAFYASEVDATQAQYQFKAKAAATAAPSGQINYVVTGPKDPTTGQPAKTTTINDLTYGRKAAEIDALGNTTRFGYSGKGNLRTVTDPNGNMTINEYDVRGNVVTVTTCQDRSANICSTSYSTYFPDATTLKPAPNIRNDRLIEQRSPGSQSATDNTYLTRYEYDDQGNRVSETDPLGRRTTITYTDGTTRGGFQGGTAPAGLPWRVVKPGGGMQTILYYPNGDVAEATDPAGEVTRYEYDGLGRTVKEIDVVKGVPGATVGYTHDRQDRVVTVKDAAITNAVTGAVHTPVTTLSYDIDGQLTAETVSDATGGDASRTVTYGYDSFGRRTSETDERGKKIEIGYDSYGQVNRQTHADGSTVITNYDAVGNEVSTVVKNFTGDPDSPSAARDLKVRQLSYDPAGRLASETDAMGWVNEFKYTDNNLLVSVTRTNGCDTAVTPGCTKQSYVLESNSYDTAGNVVTQISNNGRTKTTRAYDTLGRNTSATIEVAEDGETTTNRTTTYTYSAEDELLGTTLGDGSAVLSSIGNTYDRLGRVRQQTSYLSAGVTPTLRWKLDEKTGTTTADAAANNPGTLSNGVAWSTERGGAAVFAGGASGTIAGQAPVDTLQPYTLSAWVKLANKDADGFVAAMPGDIGSSALKVYYEKATDSWRLAMAVRDANGETSWPSGDSTYTTGSATTEWTHLAVTVTPNPAVGGANTAQLYVNGAVKAALSTTKQLNNQATGLLVGGQNATSGIFAGQIDDVQAYQKALTATEIGQLQSGALPAAGAQVSRISYGLDSDGSITSVTDAKGTNTYIQNDAVGRAVVTTSPEISSVTGEDAPVRTRSVTRVGFNTFGEVTEEKDPYGNVSINRYDGVGQIVEQELPQYTAPGASTALRPKTAAEYNSVGQVISSTDPLGAVTRYTYDQLGRTTKVVTPDDGVTRYKYDDNGELLSHTDPNGAQATSTTDYLGRTITATEAVRQAGTGYTTTYTYDSSPWPTSVKSASGVVTNFKYNSIGEQTAVTDAAGGVTKTKYDGVGRPVKVTAPDGSYATGTYDMLGRTVSSSKYAATTGELLSTQTQRFDISGNVLTASNEFNPAVAANTDLPGSKHETTFEYDEIGQLVKQLEPISASDSIESKFGYDVGGRQTRFTDGRNNRFITTYNAWGLPEQQIEPATASTPGLPDRTFTMTYDGGGRATRVDSPGGVTATSEYDVMGRLIKSSGSGAQVETKDRSFTYDLTGRVTSFTGAAGKNTVQYDDRGLITSIAGVSGNSSYAYNADGALTTRTDGAGTTSYTYETSTGRPSKVDNDTAGVHMGYSYDSMSRVKQIAYGGNTRTFTYNKFSQLESDEVKTSAGASVGKIAYGFDLDGNMTSKTTTGFNGASTNTYKYDWANRLTQWDNGVTPTVYAYDKSGNRIQAGSKTFTYDERNQLVKENSTGTTYQYSPRGTLTSTVTNGVETKTVTDAFNQVISQGTKNGGTSTYSYDGLGRMILPNLTYTGLGNDVAADGTTVYVRDIGDDLVGVASGSNQRYAWTDLHTDVVGEFSATGTALSGSVSYDPWGKIMASGGMIGKLGYQQEWTDQGTGKVNMLSRWYDPETGAFDTRDTVDNDPTSGAGAANKFAYAEGNPMTNTDPTGEGVGGKCGKYDYACEVAKYQAALKVYNTAMEVRERGMKAVGQEIVAQEAAYLRALRESNTSLLDILLQVGIGMLLDMIGYNSLVGCLGGSVMDCVDLALSALGPIKALKIGRSLYKAADRAFAGYRLWKRIVEGARTVMRRAQDMLNLARKKLNDLMSKVPKKPKPPKKKPKPPAKKKPKPKPKPEKKPAPSKQAKKPKPQKAPKKQDKPSKSKPKQSKQKDKSNSKKEKESKRQKEEGSDDSDDSDDSETASSCPDEPTPVDPETHSFDPSTKVLMADGTTRPISEVNVGDSVLTKDPVTGEVSSRQVTLLHSNRDLDLTDVTVSAEPADADKRTADQTEGKGGRSTRGPTEPTVLKTTAHHPFWDATTKKWIDAAELVPNKSTLVGPDGELQYVTGVKNFAGAEIMRDLTVADVHTYYVVAGQQPVLVHNNNACSVAGRFAYKRALHFHEQLKTTDYRGGYDFRYGTTAVVLAMDKKGKLRTIVASNEDVLDSRIRGALNKARGDVEATGEGHAEITALNYMEEQGWTFVGGATNRNTCPYCINELRDRGYAQEGPKERGYVQKNNTKKSWFVWGHRMFRRK